MTIIFRHIFKYTLSTFILLTAVLVLGAWLTQSLRFMEIIIEKDISITHYFSMIYLLLPSLTATVLPICFMIATVFTVNKLASDNELVVFKASGLSNWQISKPIFIISLFASALCLFLNQYLAPLSTERFNEKRHDISQSFSTNLIREGIFNKFKNTLIFVSEYGPNDTLKGIYIEEEKKDKKESPEPDNSNNLRIASSASGDYILFAKSGYITSTPDKNILYLFNGCRQEITSETNKSGSSKQNITYFTELKYELNIQQKDKGRSKLHNKLNFLELLNPPTTMQKSIRTKLVMEGNRRIITSLLVILYSLIATSIMINGQHKRQGRWKKPVAVVAICLTTHIFVLSLINSFWKNPYSIIQAYIVLLIFTFFSILFIFFPGLLDLIKKPQFLNRGTR